MLSNLKTRQDYINNKCSHREYYSQFVNKSVKQLVLKSFSLTELSSNDKDSFNHLALVRWDRLVPFIDPYILKSLKEYGERPDLFVGVCILKEAAKQIVEELNE